MQEVAPGILWARIPLPFRLDHVNVYLIEDDGGWAIFDTGIGHDDAKAVWDALFTGPLAGLRISKVVVSHYHPDHIGLAGWLCERFGVPLLTSQTCYLGCLTISLDPGAIEAQLYREFFRQHGMSEALANLVSAQGYDYLDMVTPLPLTFRRLVAGDVLRLGRRRFNVLSGDGHAPEQIMLYSAQDRLLLVADQVIARISPNISIWEVEPDGDPLGLFLRSLATLERDLPPDTLVLPGHQLPFRGLHERCRDLAEHHEERCDRIVQACQTAHKTVAELVPVLFPRDLDLHQLNSAFSETHAHVNHMVTRGIVTWHEVEDKRIISLT